MGIDNIILRIKEGEFKNRVRYPERPEGILNKIINGDELSEEDKQRVAQYAHGIEKWYEGREDRWIRLRQALEIEYEMVDNPKAKLLWDITNEVLSWDASFNDRARMYALLLGLI